MTLALAMPEREALQALLRRALGAPVQLAESTTSTGGCINDSRLLRLEDGRRLFLKRPPHGQAFPGMFEAEALGLRLLAAPGSLRVPRPLAWDEDFLLLEAFSPAAPAPDWQEHMGRGLALLHQASAQPRFGFAQDNWLGASRQPNGWLDDWCTFWRERRLGWQLQLFARQAEAGDRLLRLGERVMLRLDELLGEVDEPAVLLHGDLWAGNAAADDDGLPVIFDPAAYYGHREAEFGIMRLFGGFDACCEAAYQEVWPFAPGAERRIRLYRLYHELNHLNLFGASYYGACVAGMKALL